MVDLVKLLGEKPNTEAMMMEIYNFEETLAKVSHNLRNTIAKKWSAFVQDERRDKISCPQVINFDNSSKINKSNI